MLMNNSNKRFILSTIIDQILNDGNQVRVYFGNEDYKASFTIGTDIEDNKKINVVFSEVGVNEHVNFQLCAWNSLFMLFKIIDDLTFGNGEITIQRNGCKVLVMNLAD